MFRLCFHPEESAEAFVRLVSLGVNPRFVDRGADGDTIAMAVRFRNLVRRILGR